MSNERKETKKNKRTGSRQCPRVGNATATWKHASRTRTSRTLTFHGEEEEETEAGPLKSRTSAMWHAASVSAMVRSKVERALRLWARLSSTRFSFSERMPMSCCSRSFSSSSCLI
ncbi:hypothetical protein EYF80_030051 [Liparis tanakae]|uniref:Uncharacterized protein n=1 Tax=Liparis tanakae TaxID=230148 RepID=A0A4Z2H2J5_9TELE|nr:hypothetical protein EYF80_030051 [Liparis tanakae]